MYQDANQTFEICSTPEAPAISDGHTISKTNNLSVKSFAFNADGSKPLAIISQEIGEVDVYALPMPDSKVISYLKSKDIVELHQLWKGKGGWIEIRMPSGSKGYIRSQTSILNVNRVKLKDKEAEIFNQPFSNGSPITTLTKGFLFWKIESSETTDPSWIEVCLDSGEHGYIPSSTKIKTLTQITYPIVETGGSDVIAGAIWCILGIVITAGTYSAASDTGGTYLVCWGAVVFGGLQFLRGLFRLAVAVNPTNYEN